MSTWMLLTVSGLQLIARCIKSELDAADRGG